MKAATNRKWFVAAFAKSKEICSMKIINTIIVIAGILFLIVRSRAGYLNDEALIYNYQFSYNELILYSWGPLTLLMFTTFLLLVNIINKIVREGKSIKGKNYISWMFIILSMTNTFGLFFLNSENYNAILYSGWIGLFNFPFFWSNILLVLFWVSMPGLKKIILDSEYSASQKNQ